MSIYDPVGNRLVLYGGVKGGADNFDPALSSETWELKLDGQSTWKQIPIRGPHPGVRYLHSAIYDPVRRRMVVFGGLRGDYFSDAYLNDAWALSLDGTPEWRVLDPFDGVRPAPMAFTAAGYDPTEDRMIVHGGRDPYRSRYFGHELWALSLSGPTQWTRVNPGVGPPPYGTDSPGTILDVARDRVVAIHPAGSTLQVWVSGLSGSSPWMPAATTGPQPGETYWYSVAFDRSGDRILVFGGSNDNRVWTLTPTGPFSFEWSVIEVAGVPAGARYLHNAVWDSREGRLVIVGGSGPSVGTETAAIRLSGAPTWETLVAHDPTAGVSPSRRTLHGSFYDPVERRMIVMGGMYRSLGGCCQHAQCAYDHHQNDVWGLQLASVPKWERIVAAGAGPPGRAEWSVAYDPLRHRAIAYGGYAASWGQQCVHGYPEYLLSYDDSVHILDLGTTPRWSVLPTTGESPHGRRGHTAVYDPVRDRMLVFGGEVSGLWALSPEGAWSQLQTNGVPPSAQWRFAMVYEPFRDRVIVLGARDDYTTGAWALSLEAPMRWTVIETQGESPIARYGPSAVYDPIRDRVVLDGGVNHNGGAVGGTWALTLTDPPRWNPLAPPVVPGTRHGHAPVYDPEADRMLIFGGQAGSYGAYLDTWELVWGDSSLSVAVDIKPGSPLNTINPRSEGETAVAILGSERLPAEDIDFDDLRIAWVPPLQGAGRRPKSHTTDVNADGTVDLVVHVATERLAMGMEGRPIWIEGRTVQGRHFRGSDHVRAVLPPRAGATPHGSPRHPVPDLDLTVESPSSGGDIQVTFSTPRHAPATIEVTDISGRRVHREQAGDQVPGTHRFVLRPNPPLPAGIYFLRIRQESETTARKLAILR